MNLFHTVCEMLLKAATVIIDQSGYALNRIYCSVRLKLSWGCMN